jgi:hypothetical protein
MHLIIILLSLSLGANMDGEAKELKSDKACINSYTEEIESYTDENYSGVVFT